jgi:mannose-6-phosphate isomerase class I
MHAATTSSRPISSYDPNPRYRVVGGEVELGYGALARAVEPGVLLVDGPAALPWARFVAGLVGALSAAGATCATVDAREFLAPPDEVERRTGSAELPGDPVFGRLFEGALSALFEGASTGLPADADVTVVFGPGAALLAEGAVWYADLPKRLALEAVRAGTAGNVGVPGSSERRLLFVDWPMLDRHKRDLLPRLDRYVDLTDVAAPRSLDGESLRRSLDALACRPFRVRPSFLPGPWGGQWLRRTLGVPTEAPNLAWSYELITPESGVLLGDLEVGFELLMAGNAEAVLGPDCAARFGVDFPIRFDYLDTLGGGHLSLQCHPREEYARDVFGLSLTQLETYYVMVTTPGAKIFLGLREGADPDALRADPESAVETVPAEQHHLYLIPSGTVHASGAGNVVLEISATPYLYTLRFYDWERPRPIHLEHAFANLEPGRRARDLMPEPRTVRPGELELGRHPELFFAVHRLELEDEIEDDTAGRFHVLNLVEGEQVEVGGHVLSYAETLVVPASVGAYRIRRLRGPACKVVKAFVP